MSVLFLRSLSIRLSLNQIDEGLGIDVELLVEQLVLLSAILADVLVDLSLVALLRQGDQLGHLLQNVLFHDLDRLHILVEV